MKLNIDTRGSIDLLVTFVACLFVIFSSQFGGLHYAHSAMGWSVALFFLGYSIISFAFPAGQKYTVTGFSSADNISGISLTERLIGSFFLSLALTSFSQFIFNSLLIPSGLGFFADISIICFISSLAALYRRLNVEQNDRFTVEYEVEIRNWTELAVAEKRKFAFALVLVIVVSTISIDELSQEKMDKSGFTEIYFSDQSGNAVYPDQVNTSDNSELYIQINNYEKSNRDFKLQIEHLFFSSDPNFNITSDSTPLDSHIDYEVDFLSLKDGKNTFSHDFSFDESGLWCIQASLFMPDGEETSDKPYRQLRFLIRVN